MDTDPIPPASPSPAPGLGASPDPVTPTPLPHVTTDAAGKPPLTVSSPLATDSGLTPNVAAGLAVVLTIMTGIIFLFLEKRNQFVRFWAMQAVFFGAATIVFAVISTVIGTTLWHTLTILGILWSLCSFVVHLAFIAVWVIMMIKAFSGKEWELPYLGKMAREQLARTPLM